MESPTKEALIAAVEHHPILALPREQRLSSPLAKEFQELLLQVKGFDKQLNRNLTVTEAGGGSFANEVERNRKAVYWKAGKKKTVYDTIAFLNSVASSLKYYDPEKGGSFMAYFDRCYERDINKALNEEMYQESGMKWNPKHADLAKMFSTFCEKENIDPQKLTDEQLERVAKVLHTKKETVRTIMVETYQLRRQVSLDETDDGKDGAPKPRYDVADESAQESFREIEQNDVIANIIGCILDADLSEHLRIFFTNDTIRPIKTGSTDEARDYCAMLEKYRTPLWKKVFVLGYIDFVFPPPPENTSVWSLFRAENRYALVDATIAQYRKVSPAAISKQRKKYELAMRDIALAIRQEN